MVAALGVAVDPPEPQSGVTIPSSDAVIFSQDGVSDGGLVLDDLDFDLSFDDLSLPLSEELESLLTPDVQYQSDLQTTEACNISDQYQSLSVFKSTSSEMRHILEGCEFFYDQFGDSSRVLNSTSPEDESNLISSYLNIQSPESNGSNRGSGDVKETNSLSPKFQGSKNLLYDDSENSNDSPARSIISFPNHTKTSILVDQKISDNFDGNHSSLKRKNDEEYILNTNSESWSNKCMKSSHDAEYNNTENSNGVMSEEEEKKKARLMRNRESAQLSRQRKKHYVEELEDKVKNMQSTIQDLNSKISYFIAENVALRQQMNSGIVSAPAAPPMAHPPMIYPWIPYAPPYMIKPQGSQVPLVPIPRLKPQQTTQAPKKVETKKVEKKKVETKKSEAPKGNKVVSVSFLGLLFFTMLFGCLVPLVNVRYGEEKASLAFGENYLSGGLKENHHRRVLMFNETDSNNPEPLAASLYVPRNDKLVKIDGNLIIQSVLASEKAMASNQKVDSETSLAVPGELASAIALPSTARHSQMRVLGSSSVENDDKKTAATDGSLQQWFREGLAGPMLTAGMCTEVFQFDVSTAIVPTTAKRNITENQNGNSTYLSKGLNRRFLHTFPIPESSQNVSTEHGGSNSEKDGFHGHTNSTSMIVSVLFDPREAGDLDVDGVMGTKILSRIFVVVLVDSIKYVTYSCMLPLKGSI